MVQNIDFEFSVEIAILRSPEHKIVGFRTGLKPILMFVTKSSVQTLEPI